MTRYFRDRSSIAMLLLSLAGLPVSGCAGDRPQVRVQSIAPPPPPPVQAGLDRVLGRDAAFLYQIFGIADQDVREPGARRLQYAGPICVLDAYLYASAPGREPVVTHVDARLSTGQDIDRASCIAALTRRREAR